MGQKRAKRLESGGGGGLLRLSKSRIITFVLYILFQGGTNFGFMNGANHYRDEFRYSPTVTSYGKLSVNKLTNK